MCFQTRDMKVDQHHNRPASTLNLLMSLAVIFSSCLTERHMAIMDIVVWKILRKNLLTFSILTAGHVWSCLSSGMLLLVFRGKLTKISALTAMMIGGSKFLWNMSVSARLRAATSEKTVTFKKLVIHKMAIKCTWMICLRGMVYSQVADGETAYG